MADLQLDARKWRFLDNPNKYANSETAVDADLQCEPLERQFRTAKEILFRFQKGHSVLLADDVGLGKTTVAALIAWVIACQGKRVRIYAPNKVLQRRWAEELERHVPMLEHFGASYDRIKQGNTGTKQGDVGKLNAGRIQVSTHFKLIESYRKGEERTACDLMIIDEAHRAKGDGSRFNEALHNLGDRATRKLILTATPFSIRLTDLEQLLCFVGAKKIDLDKVRYYANKLKSLYELGGGHDVDAEADRLVSAARAAIDGLQPYLIRHGIDDLSAAEREHFGAASAGRWDIPTAPATRGDLELLLRMVRLLELTPERKGVRRNDPRFHIGWQQVGTELKRVNQAYQAAKRANCDNDYIVLGRHIEEAKNSLRKRQKDPHPKVLAVSGAIRSTVVNGGEKVLVFCHHRATASELLGALEKSLKAEKVMRIGPPEKKVWSAAWGSLLRAEELWPNEQVRPRDCGELMEPIVDWLCSSGIRWQVAGWLDKPATNAEALADQLKKSRPRHADAEKVPTIAEAARTLVKSLLDEQSKSTRALLRNMKRKGRAVGASHLPGRLDEGLRVMGWWTHDHGDPPKTLYTGNEPDIVLALFNSPFGPDVLVTTDRLSEGVDLHRYCRHLIHYELDPSPVRTLQRNGRLRRVGSWAALTGRPICYAYPAFGGTRDERAVAVMEQRISAFGLLLGGVPTIEDQSIERDQSFAMKVLDNARKRLEKLNRHLHV
ncbi:hypothetical protein DVT68_10705 [Dyella solisilvae]|uniref:ATP-dependent helicase n=1 Tax=Dyella solisilvae TaxID=1920168 RepID=A0A370K937_9GAMM|nr:SNF2-related protein [Dyella solisilvae]RDI98957.1 hypothetical protein DVT68_10705 [Dyella solisilvae]